MTFRQAFLSSVTPATPFHCFSKVSTSSQSFLASAASPALHMLCNLGGVARTHRTVSYCFLLFNTIRSSESGFILVFTNLFCEEPASDLVVSAMWDIAGESVDVVGVRGSIFVRIYVSIHLATRQLEKLTKLGYLSYCIRSCDKL